MCVSFSDDRSPLNTTASDHYLELTATQLTVTGNTDRRLLLTHLRKEIMKGKKTTYGSFTLTRSKPRRWQRISRKQIGYQPICQYHDSTRSHCDGLFIPLGTVTAGGTGNGTGTIWNIEAWSLIPVSNQREHFCIIYKNLLIPFPIPLAFPIPVQYEYTMSTIGPSNCLNVKITVTFHWCKQGRAVLWYQVLVALSCMCFTTSKIAFEVIFL